MKINTFEYPKSSFLGLAKDTSLVIGKILENQTILKLLYFNVPDVLLNPSLQVNDQQKRELLENKIISNVPRIPIDGLKNTYIRISFTDFVPSDENPYFRDHFMDFKVVCHYDLWNLYDYELRPHRIVGELDSMFNNKVLTGIGRVLFVTATQDIYDDEFGGMTLRFLIVSGNEDKVNTVRKMQ